MKITLFIASLLLFSEAFANNLFIPNYYRSRRTQNEFSALGWSDRKEANIEYGTGTGKADDGTTEVDQDTTALRGDVFYRMNETTNVEFTYNSDETKPEGASSEKASGWDLGLGYQFGNQPMVLGFSYESSTDDATGTDVDTTAYSLGLGYRLENNWFLGLGYRNSKDDAGATDETATTTAIGAGYVWGDLKKPTAAVEFAYQMLGSDWSGNTISAQGLWNHDAAQYYLSIASLSLENAANEKITGTLMKLGVDYMFTEHWYTAPELTMNNSKNDDTDVESKDNNWSLEVGYREHTAWEAFLRYDSNKNELEATGAELKTTGTVFTVGGTYFF